MRIIELDRNQQTHQDTEITVAGAVRSTYNEPFAISSSKTKPEH